MVKISSLLLSGGSFIRLKIPSLRAKSTGSLAWQSIDVFHPFVPHDKDETGLWLTFIMRNKFPVKNILKMRQNSNLRHKTTAYLLHL
jgi:hypothetical protein